MAEILVRGGCVVDMRPQPVVLRDTDVHVADGRIAAVGPGLAAPGADVLDARQRIVLPGFVDTHRHGWQSVLRASALDVDLGGYLERVAGGLAQALHPADVATAGLLTGLECLDAGVTTVQDHAHIAFTPEHAAAVVEGLRASGVRAVFGYGRPVRSQPQPWRAGDVRRLRAQVLPDDDGLVTMLLAALGPAHGDVEETVADWRLARELDLRVAVHIGATPAVPRPVALLRELGVVAPGTLYVHGNSLPDDEVSLIAGTGGALSITPAVEARMGHGPPMLGRVRALGVPAGLGVDVVTTVPGDLFSVMRAALLSVDASGGERVPMADVLQAATLGGATALGMADRIGSLRVGAQADIVLLRTDAVATAGGHDPVGLAVNAHPGLVDTVLVAGRVVKRDGRLLHPGVGDVVAAANEVARRLAGF
ncbi:amidohydrolase family protein [Pseudonocardia adelaidensis]|uniref:Amidohydrolase family protein n=1 Tax=Pseudonocardia adelaidensis TaxID=648754 RepID=A0ABP9NK58_9PSEU